MEIKLLSCPLCTKPHFQGVDSLRSSLISVATSQLSCPICNESLLGLDKLTIHLFTHINEEPQEQQQEQEQQQQLQIEESLLKKNEDEIDKTINIEKNGDDSIKDRVKCDICNFTFVDQTILDMHTKLLHQTIPDKQGLYNYHCHLCSKKFKKRGSLMVHLRVAHYGFAHNCNDDTKSNEDQSVKVQDNKQWECDVCSKMFTTKYFLKKHKRLHTGEMPYFCNQCNKSFTFQQSYHKHMLYHSSEKPYVCNECGRAFKELSTLQNHARIHSGERPFGCETCGKRFRQRVSYLVHQRIHTGVMPYKCTACEKTFRYKVSQRSHKCPANPPGSVVRITESSGISETPGKIVMSLDFNPDTGNVNLVQNKVVTQEQPAETTIYLTSQQPDLFTMSLSPLMPDVESLCLTSSSSSPPPQMKTVSTVSETPFLIFDNLCNNNESTK